MEFCVPKRMLRYTEHQWCGYIKEDVIRVIDIKNPTFSEKYNLYIFESIGMREWGFLLCSSAKFFSDFPCDWRNRCNMPVSQRISDAELRQRLEVVNQGDIILKDFHRTFQDHNYNVPPITDSTRRTLINKLKQLDQDSAHRSRKQVHGFRTKTKARVLKTKAMENLCKAYTGLDYSSAEDDEFPAPRASSTMVGTIWRLSRRWWPCPLASGWREKHEGEWEREDDSRERSSSFNKQWRGRRWGEQWWQEGGWAAGEQERGEGEQVFS